MKNSKFMTLIWFNAHLQSLHQVWFDGVFHQHSQGSAHALQRKNMFLQQTKQSYTQSCTQSVTAQRML